MKRLGTPDLDSEEIDLFFLIHVPNSSRICQAHPVGSDNCILNLGVWLCQAFKYLLLLLWKAFLHLGSSSSSDDNYHFAAD